MGHKPGKASSAQLEQVKNLANRMTMLYPEKPTGSDGEHVAATDITNSCIALMALPKINTYSADEVRQRTIEYFDIARKYNVKPTLESYALALRITRETVLAISSGLFSRPPEVREIVIMAHQTIQAMMAGFMTDSKVNPIAGIFLMKNNMGYSNDDNPMRFAPVNTDADNENVEDKYEHLLDD